jgi:transketolase
VRNAFADEITRLAQADERIVLLSGDIGNRLFDKFKEACPKRFYNCGVAEANMVGMAAGLAMCGLRPVCYTIAPFLTYRCMEQIRVDLCYHHVPVVLVGTGAGLAYASLGATHHSCEEVGMLRLLPGMNVMAPGDAWEVRACLDAALAQDNPTYIRIGKKGEPLVHESKPDLHLGRAIRLGEGKDIALLSSGAMLPHVVALGKLLEAQGFQPAVFSFPTVKPLDTQLLEKLFADFRVVATVEEHSVLGGLGGSIAEWKADHPKLPARLLRFGTDDVFLHETCEQEEAHEFFHLVPAQMAERIAAALR